MTKKPKNSEIEKTVSSVQRSKRAVKKISNEIDIQMVRYSTGDQSIEFNIDVTAETVWATQQQIADLYGIARSTVAEHIQHIISDEELEENSVCRKFRQTASDGKEYQTTHYDLDMILAVGFRARSPKARRFRQWAYDTLRNYIVHGYALNEARLRDDPHALRNLAARIRSLRADEKNIYAAVRECFKISSSDYSPSARETRSFYAHLQNKFLYAITGKTAPELVLERADHNKLNMGITCLGNERPKIADAKIGKNYLDGEELYMLHLLCEQVLLFAESKAIRGQSLTMADFIEKFDRLLEMNEYPVFHEYREYLKDRAIEHAQVEFARWQNQQIREGKLADPKKKAS